MRNFIVLALAALFLSACAGSKEIEFTSLNQAPCKDQIEMKTADEFVSETAENLTVYQQGKIIYAAMDIRTYCNARITFDLEADQNIIKLKVRNASTQKDNCICITNVTTSFTNVEPGSYKVFVTNAAGNQLLAESDLILQ
jgi:hypothetical protein